MAPQSFSVAVVALRSVVATTLKFGYAATAVSIIGVNVAGSSSLRCSSTPSISKPSAAEKSSSLPSMTSTYGASRRFTSRALAWPPIDFHSESR